MKVLKFILKLIYWLLQWTWGIIQNISGLVLWGVIRLFYRASKSRMYRGAVLTNWPVGGGISLGMFIFVQEGASEYLKRHEYGHTLQSIILGPLYLLIIGFPSLIWANFPPVAKKWDRSPMDYYDFYAEKWANRCGASRFLKDDEEKA